MCSKSNRKHELETKIKQELQYLSQNTDKIARQVNENAKLEQLDEILYPRKGSKTYREKKRKADKYHQLYKDEKKDSKYILNVTTIEELESVRPQIQFVHGNSELTELWDFLHFLTASSRTTQGHGKCIKAFLYDTNSEKYMGLITVSSDKSDLQVRDRFIGWSKTTRMSTGNTLEDKHIQKKDMIFDISTCVPLQPIGTNLGLGSLLSQLPFCSEFQEKIKGQWGHYAYCYTTMGLYGRSDIYDRNPHLEHIGYTDGYSTMNISDKLWDMINEYLGYHGITKDSYGTMATKIRKLRDIATYMELNENDVKLGNQKGVYIGMTDSRSKDYLCGKSKPFKPRSKNLTTIYANWLVGAKARLIRRIKNSEVKSTSINYISKAIKEHKKKLTTEEQNTQTTVEDDSELTSPTEQKESIERKRKSIAVIRDYRTIDYDVKTDTLIGCDVDYKTTLHNAYLAGFIDGDGSILLSNAKKDRKSGKLLVPSVCISQAVPEPLLLIHKQFGGCIRKVKPRGTNQRVQYNLSISYPTVIKVLKAISPHLRLKYNKCQLALDVCNRYHEYMHNEKLQEEARYKMEFYSSNYRNEEIRPLKRTTDTIQYITGLFDAEGYVELKHETGQLSTSLAQANSPKLLKRISQHIGFGSFGVNRDTGLETHLNFYGENAFNFIKEIRNISTVKRKQIDAAIIFLNTKNEIKTKIKNESNRRIEKSDTKSHALIAKKILYEEKHGDVTLTDSVYAYLQKHSNKINRSIVDSVMTPDMLASKNSSKKITRDLQSSAKRGANNPNFGSPLGETHALNIAMSNIESARKYSDEDILEVYDLYRSGHTISEIQTLKQIANHGTVQRMLRYANVLRGEISKYEYVLQKRVKRQIKDLLPSDILPTQEREYRKAVSSGLNKRRYNRATLLTILKLCYMKIKGEITCNYKDMSVYVRDNEGKPITTDTYKNLSAGKTKVYSFDFNDQDIITQEEYIDLVNRYEHRDDEAYADEEDTVTHYLTNTADDWKQLATQFNLHLTFPTENEQDSASTQEEGKTKKSSEKLTIEALDSSANRAMNNRTVDHQTYFAMLTDAMEYKKINSKIDYAKIARKYTNKKGEQLKGDTVGNFLKKNKPNLHKAEFEHFNPDITFEEYESLKKYAKQMTGR